MDFVARATELWDGRWDYSQVEYSNNHTKVDIVCSDHGVFSQTPKLHLLKRVGCPGCKSNRMTTQQYVQKAQDVWGDRWDYSSTVYTHSEEPVTIACLVHGEFTQVATQHLMGKVGCKGCSYIRVNQEEFLTKALAQWGDRWDYSNTQYSGYKNPITVRCREHGEFTQQAGAHLSGAVGCVECWPRPRKTQDEFIMEAKEVWGDRWDYSLVEYSDRTTKVKIVCVLHGEFSQTPVNHLRGVNGCVACSRASRLDTNNEYVAKATQVWGNRWDYSGTLYSSSKELVRITCREHGTFTQRADGHINGYVGCPQCYTQPISNMETDLGDFVESLGVAVERNKRNLLPPFKQEIDVFVPDQRVAFEFNGLYWHGSTFKPYYYHYDKWFMAKSNHIKLIQIWEDDWRDRQDIVKEHIRQVLGVSTAPRIFARKTTVVALNTAEAHNFLEKYHIQGKANASIYLGLQDSSGGLVAVTALVRSGNDLVLSRYATSCNVVGGHSKLVAYVERNFQYGKLITFADLTFGGGDLYRSTGWIEDTIIRPDYSYVVSGSRRHKFNYRRKRFKTDPSLLFVEELSESQLAELNKIPWVYDAGKIRFIKPKKDDTTG